MKAFLVVIASFVILGALMEGCDPETPEERAEKDARYAEIVFKTNALESVRRLLKDPESAELRGASIMRSDGVEVVCGEVNSKNGFGAYTGYQYFISGGNRPSTYLQEQVKDFSVLWSKLCT